MIMYVACPLIWVSKLQTEVALSTTKAEYIALSQEGSDPPSWFDWGANSGFAAEQRSTSHTLEGLWIWFR
jgi:hypothetical protein